MALGFLLLASTLTMVTPGWTAGLTYGREKLKGTSKTEGDYNLQPRCRAGQVSCGSTCANVQTDSRNCNSCGVACAKGEICANGSCERSGATRTTK
jgi:hypothetical protein